MRRPRNREERTGPSPIDDALLNLTRDLAEQFKAPYRYSRIAWARFVRGDGDWMLSDPVLPGVLSDVELLLPEYLKGKLSLDEWRILIALHLVRLTVHNRESGVSRFLGKFALVPRSLFFLLLVYVPVILASPRSSPGSIVVLILPSPLPLLVALWLRRSLRRSLKTREFEMDKIVADRSGPPQVSQVLGKMETMGGYNFRSGLVSHWNPSIEERVEELNNPRFTGPLRPSIVPRIGLRGRAIITLFGLGVFWGSGFVAGNLYLRGGSSVVCMDNTCAALVVISVLAFWMAVITGTSVAISLVRRLL